MKCKPVTFALFSILLILLSSCHSAKDVSPEDAKSSYAVPVTRPFTLPEAKPINWKVYPADSFPKATTVPLNIAKLPSRAFSANEFKPLKEPIRTIPFNWNDLPQTAITLDSLSYQPVKYRKFKLPRPQVVPASSPGLVGKGNAGLINLGPSEGLTGSKVLAIIQDRDGSTWITTERGLNKYTGTEFESYNFFEKDPIGAVEVLGDMEIDSAGRLLITGLISGIYRIDTRMGIVEHFKWQNGFGRCSFDSQGRFWVANKDAGLFQLDMDKHRIAKFRFWNNGIEDIKVYGLLADKAGNLWVGFNKHIAIINPDFSSMRQIGAKEQLNIEVAFDFDENQSGDVWISAFSRGAYAVSLKEQRITWLGPDHGIRRAILDVFIDGKNRSWLISSDTAFVYNEKDASLKKVVTGVALIAGNFPSSGTKAKDGMIWLGTNADGVALIDPAGLLPDHFNKKDGLESNDVWGITEDSKRRIWLASYKGLQVYDPKTERISTFKFPPGININEHRQISKIAPDRFFLGTVDGFAIIDLQANTATFYNTVWNNINTITFTGIMDSQGALWFAGGNGLLVFDEKKKTFKQFDASRGLISDVVFITRQDRSGRIWLCGETGTTIVSPEANTYRTLTEANGLSGSYSAMFLQSNAGNIYIGSDNGFSILDQELKTIMNIGAENGMKPPLMYDMIEWNKQVHIGTENGITIVAAQTEKDKLWHFYNYAKSAGFAYNDYNQSTAYVTSYGNVWWGAAPVLTVVHQDPTIDTLPAAVVIKGITIMDQSPSFVNRAAVKSQLSNGDSIEIGGKRYGAASLPSDSGYLAKNNIKWDSVYTGFQLPAGLRLPYHQNSFNFTFANQSPAARDKIVYRFILEGEDERWSAISEKPVSRIYYNVKPGHYTFKVISRGLNGVWSQPASFEFTILPPWWQTWWAYLLYALVAAGTIYIIVRVRSAMLHKENRLLEKKVQLRTEALHQKMEELKAAQSQLVQSEKMASLGELTAGVAHEIQNPLNFINNFSEINQELLTDMYDEIKKGDLNAIEDIARDIQLNEEKIFHHGRRADGIVKSMLQHSRSNSNITKEPTDINKLADEYLRLAYHGLRAKDKSFNAGMKTDFDESIPPVSMVPQDIGRVILNLLTNAFYAVNEKAKTAEQGFKPMVSISTKRISDKIEIVVGDNGFGISKNIVDKIFQPFFTTKPTGQGTGLGLSMSYDIVTKAHGGELKVKSQEGEGTKFSIVLPINNS